MHERINAIISAIRGHLGTGDRPLGVKDFYRICQIDNIIVEEVSSARSFILKPQAAGGGAAVIGLTASKRPRSLLSDVPRTRALFLRPCPLRSRGRGRGRSFATLATATRSPSQTLTIAGQIFGELEKSFRKKFITAATLVFSGVVAFLNIVKAAFDDDWPSVQISS